MDVTLLTLSVLFFYLTFDCHPQVIAALGTNDADVYECEIISFTEGSIIVDYGITVDETSAPSDALITLALIDYLSNSVELDVDGDSIQISGM